MGVSVGVKVSVGVGEIVGVGVKVVVGMGLVVNVGVEVANTVVRSRLTVKTEANAKKSRSVIPPPTIQPLQFIFLGTTIFKSRGTLIRTTVVLSCPPRWLAVSINCCAATLGLFFERITSAISSFQTRSVSPSLQISNISPGRI